VQGYRIEWENKPTTDLDLPLARRTQANLWKSKYFEIHKELVAANKGIRRLRRKLERLQSVKRKT